MSRRHERDQRFELICRAAFDAILVHDNGTIIEASGKCAQLFGFGSPSELVGRTIFDLIASELHDQARMRVRNRETEVHTSVGVRADGSRFTMEACGVTTNDGSMRVVAVRDITARVEAEAELRAIADRYRGLIENSHDLVCTHDLSGRVLSANPAAARALGLDVAEIVGRSIQEFLLSEGTAGFSDYMRALRRDGVASGTMVVRATNGSRRIWEYRNSLRSGDTIVYGIARDITDREEANRALRFSEDHFRSIIENVSDFISIIEKNGVIGYSSPSVETLLGWKPAEIVGTWFADIVHPDDQNRAREFFATGSKGHIALRLRDCLGAWRSFEVASKTIKHDGRDAVIATARDITDRVLLEKQLEQANRLTSLGRLAATVAHEFNNVLMGMLPFAELLQRPSISKEATAKAAGHIVGSVSRGKRIVQEILRFTRPAEPDIRPLKLATWWQTFGRELAAQTPDHIQLTAEFGDECVLADAHQLSQAISNIVANAREAMPRGGGIRIAARPASDHSYSELGIVPHLERCSHIIVSDDGAGIPPEVMNHIFDPLFTTKQTGTGLGLAIAHQVITRHNGYIFVESEVGKGTSFHIFLPSSDAVIPTAAEDQTGEPREVAAQRVMIVEDEDIIVDGIITLLAHHGIETASVSTGEEAAGAVRKFRPDVVVMDIGLPGIDGVEAYRRIRDDGFTRPVIFATGHGDHTHLAELPPDPLIRFLQKPFEIDQLLRTIADLERVAAGVP